MRKIEVLKEIKYRRYPIYVRKTGTRFEYILIFNNQIYSNYFDLIPRFFMRFTIKKFSDDEIKEIIKVILVSAQTLIDLMIKKYGRSGKKVKK